MIILLIICISDGPTSADLSNIEESNRRPTSAGLSNIEESKRRLGYQLHKIGYTLCVSATWASWSYSNLLETKYCMLRVCKRVVEEWW